MTGRFSTTRRALMQASLGILAMGPALGEDAPPPMRVTKDPSCGCCGAWVDNVRGAGFAVQVVETANTNVVKDRLGVPAALRSCHTAEIGKYVLEGHVPVAAIQRLLREKPDGAGLAVAGMPVGSLGMEAPGEPNDVYDVVLFGEKTQRVFARYRGSQEI